MKRSLVLVTSLVVSINTAQVTSTTAQDLNCLLTEEGPLFGQDDDNDLVEDHEYTQFSQSDRAISFVSKMRKKPSSFYSEVVDNIIMTLCDVETESERCVPEESSLAAKNWDESCVVAKDFKCPQGMCERTSNCYWKAVSNGKNRTKRFSEEKFEMASDYLYGTSNSYARDVAQTGIIGIIISSVLLLLWLLYFIGRFCCCCLWTKLCYMCSPIPREEGYKICRQWLFPILMYMTSFAGILGAGSIAFIGNEVR